MMPPMRLPGQGNGVGTLVGPQHIRHDHGNRPGAGSNRAEQGKTLRRFLENVLGQTALPAARIVALRLVDLKRHTLP